MVFKYITIQNKSYGDNKDMTESEINKQPAVSNVDFK